MARVNSVYKSRSRSSKFSTSPGFRSVFFGFSWTRWRRGFSHFSPKTKKVRHNLRTRGRNCLRTRAHGRRRLMTRPWCSRRRRMRSRSWMRRRRLARLLWRLSMWSATGGGGGNSGTRRRSSSAGGSLRLMALSSATPSGALHGTFLNVPVIMLDKFQQSWFLLCRAVHVVCVLGLGSFPRQSDGHSSWVPRWRCTVHTVRRTVEFHWSSFLVWC